MSILGAINEKELKPKWFSSLKKNDISALKLCAKTCAYDFSYEFAPHFCRKGCSDADHFQRCLILQFPDFISHLIVTGYHFGEVLRDKVIKSETCLESEVHQKTHSRAFTLEIFNDKLANIVPNTVGRLLSEQLIALCPLIIAQLKNPFSNHF